MNNNISKIIISLILSIGFIVGMVLASQNFRKSRIKAQEISVTGNAERNISSDVVVWETNFEVYTSNDIKSAYRTLSDHRKIVEEYLIKKGLSTDEFSFEGVSISKDTQYREIEGEYRNVLKGYVLRQSVQVISKNLDLVDSVSREITELLDQGIFLLSQAPNYYYSKLEEFKHDMLELASRDALKRAEAIATGSDRHVGKLLRSQMGVFQITGLYSNEDYSWGGNFNTNDREKTISVTVKNSYEVH